MNATRLSERYEFARCEYQSDEWETMKDAGWQTLCVSDGGMALMRRERRP
jgi:hypothetical protein